MRAVAVVLLGVLGCGRVGFTVSDRDGSVNELMTDAAPADGPLQPAWQFVATKGASNSNGVATLTVTLGAASVAGQLMVVLVDGPSGKAIAPSAITDNASNTFTEVIGARASSTTSNDTLQVFYTSSANAGATSVVVVGQSLFTVVVWQWTTAKPAMVDTAVGLSDQAKSAIAISPPITTASTGELVLASAIVFNQITGLHTGTAFTNDSLQNANGFAHLTDPLALPGTYQATWDQSGSSAYCSNAVAFIVGQ